jgi:hypothetical protein
VKHISRQADVPDGTREILTAEALIGRVHQMLPQPSEANGIDHLG